MLEKRQKVVMLSGYYPFMSGGGEYQSYLLAGRLREFADVSYIYIQSSRLPAYIEHDGFHLYGIPKKKILRRLGDILFLYHWEVWRLLQKIRPDVIYHRAGSGLTATTAKYGKRFSCKTIWHIASRQDVEPCPIHMFSRSVLFDMINSRLKRYMVQNIGTIIAQTKEQNELLHSNYGRRADLIVGNYHPLPPTLSPEKNDFAKKTIIWVANIKTIKRPEAFAELAHRFCERSDIQWVMVGRGTVEFCENTGLSNLVGMGELPQESVNQLINRSWLAVNTSRTEGFSNSLIQSWFRGVPTYTLGVDPDHVIRDFGLGVSCNDVPTLSKKIAELIEQPTQRSQMSQNAVQYAVTYHSMNNIELIMPYFMDVVDGHDSPQVGTRNG